MAINTAGKTEWAEAIPTLVAQRALQVLRKIATFTRSVYTNGDVASFGTPFNVGTTLNIRLPNSYTARDKTEDTAITYDDETPTKVAIVLDKYKYVAIAPEDIARMVVNIPNGDIIQEEAEPIAYALVQAIETQLAGHYTDFSQIGSAGSNITPDLVREAAQTLDDNNVPDDGQRYLKLLPKDIYALLGHADFIPYFAAAQTEAIRDGVVGRMYGFQIDKSQYVYSSGGTTYGMAYHRSAIALVTRPFLQPMSPGVAQATVPDSETGLALTTVMAWDQLYQADSLVTKIVYGSKTLRASLGVTVLT